MGNSKNIFFLALGHFGNDSLYSSLPPLLPLLVAAYGLSTALVGALPALYMVVASFLQPIFGQMFDRRQLTWLMSLGLLIGGVSVMSIGYVGSYAAVLAAAIAGGIGSALFHPVATSLSSLGVGRGRAFSVGLFMLGGNLGLAAGPLIIVSTIGLFNIKGTFIAFVLPAIAAAALSMTRDGSAVRVESPDRVASVDRRALSMVLLASVLRGTATITLITYIPLYLTKLGFSLGAGGLILSTMLLAGGAGMVLSGWLADRVNRVLVSSAILLASAPTLLAFTSAPVELTWVLAAVMGFTLIAAHPVLVVMAHELLPGRTGLASALIYGVAFGVSNLTVPVWGLAIDTLGFQQTLQILPILPAAAGILTLVARRRIT